MSWWSCRTGGVVGVCGRGGGQSLLCPTPVAFNCYIVILHKTKERHMSLFKCKSKNLLISTIKVFLVL